MNTCWLLALSLSLYYFSTDNTTGQSKGVSSIISCKRNFSLEDKAQQNRFDIIFSFSCLAQIFDLHLLDIYLTYLIQSVEFCI